MLNGGSDIPLAVVGCDFRVASSRWRSRLVLDDEEARHVASELKRNQAAEGSTADTNTVPGSRAGFLERARTVMQFHLRTAGLQDAEHTAFNGEFDLGVGTEEASEACADVIELALQHRGLGAQFPYRFEGLRRRQATNQVIAASAELHVPGKGAEPGCCHPGKGNHARERNSHLVHARFQLFLV